MRRLACWTWLGLMAAAWAAPCSARQITDMVGRKVTVPDKITKVFAGQPYTNVLMYMVAPTFMLGVQPGCMPFNRSERQFLRKDILNLPELMNPGSQSNLQPMGLEAMLRLKPDIVLVSGGMLLDVQRIQDQYNRLHLPVVAVKLDSISDYPAALTFMGKLLRREGRARELNAYMTRVFGKVNRIVKAIPPQKRVRVYYAESPDGLATEAEHSFHAEAIQVAGGALVHKGDIKTHMGMERVSLEQVILYNPEVIISQYEDFTANAPSDPRWRKVRAAARRRIYTVPCTPFNWIDRPPTTMRIVGVPWVTYLLYPKQYGKNAIREDIAEFHRLFMGTNVPDAKLDEWLK